MSIGEGIDEAFRSAAFTHVRRLQTLHGHVSSEHLRAGFEFQGARLPLVNPQRGIFKPRQMRFLLSIRTVFPRSGAKVWYDDQRRVHQQIFDGVDRVEYAFMGDNPQAAENAWLREAFETQTPVLYFLGTSPGRYQAVVPTFISNWNAKDLKAELAFGLPGENRLSQDTIDRRYALREVKQRLHQASFREAVISAYRGKCALSGLPEPMLLDAAHIISDGNESLGQPVVPNGIPLSKIHHAAFDAHLLGIDADFKVHVAERLQVQHDGPMLEALKRLHNSRLHLPERTKDLPDRDRLAQRFEIFLAGV